MRKAGRKAVRKKRNGLHVGRIFKMKKKILATMLSFVRSKEKQKKIVKNY